jgi:prepilin-type N-terminal cleavage/methylation domain-containing protein
MHAERGLTLLELLVVLTILGLVSGLAATAYGGRAGREEDRVRNEVRQSLRGARQEAMRSGRIVHVELSDRDHAGPAGRLATVLRQAKGDARFHWAPQGSASVDMPTFYPDGSAAPGTLGVGTGSTVHRIEIDWRGGIHDADDRP